MSYPPDRRAGRGPALRRLGLVAAALAIPLGGSGCTTPPAASTDEPVDVAAAVAAVAMHNERVARLDRIAGRGVLEIAWEDVEGRRHREPQVDARVWIELPRHTALRAEKLGEDLLWLGSNDDRYWLFDLTRKDEDLLYVGRHDVAATAAAGLPVPIAPLSLLDLMGLSPLARPDGDTGIAAGPETWIVDGAGAGGPVRLHLRRTDGVPLRVDVLAPDGSAVVMSSRLRRYASVPLRGTAIVGRPRMAKLIDVEDAHQTFAVKVAIGEVEGASPDEAGPWLRVFDLEGLSRHLRPDRTIRLDDAANARTAAGAE